MAQFRKTRPSTAAQRKNPNAADRKPGLFVPNTKDHYLIGGGVIKESEVDVELFRNNRLARFEFIIKLMSELRFDGGRTSQWLAKTLDIDDSVIKRDCDYASLTLRMATNVQELGSKTAIILNRALAQAIQSNDFNKMTKVLKVSTYYLATENNTKDQEKNYDLKVKEFEQKIKESSDDLTYSQLSDEEISKKLVDIVKKIKK